MLDHRLNSYFEYLNVTGMTALFGSRSFIRILAIALILLGIIIRYRLNKRKFNRRNYSGVEEFRSYGNMKFTVIIENIAWFFGVAMITIGMIALLLTWLLPPQHFGE
jgi:hypothetical protein